MTNKYNKSKIYYYYNKAIDTLNAKKPVNFQFLHIPKTGGTYIRSRLSWKYIQPHEHTVNVLTSKKIYFNFYTTIRNPFEYYNSTFNELFVQREENLPSERFEYLNEIISQSKNRSIDSLINASLNLNENLINSKVWLLGRSSRFPIFKYLKEFDIGLYSFFMLNQFSTLKIEDINHKSKIEYEFNKINDKITTIKLENIDQELKKLAKENNLYLKNLFLDKNENVYKMNIDLSQNSLLIHKERYAFKLYNLAI